MGGELGKFAKGGGKETLFRVSLRNQIRLMGIIDKKANMLLTVSTLILTLVLGYLSGNLVYNKSEALKSFNEEMPFFFLVLFEIICILFSILSSQYELIMKNKKIMESPMQFTLLFDKSISIEDYLRRMGEILASNDELYKVLSIDLFFMRKIILKKRFYLNIAYLFFSLGFLGAIFNLFALYFL